MAAVAAAGTLGPSPTLIEWALATQALAGEQESGDLHAVVVIPDGAFLAVVDGLGHGPEAASAARAAAEVLGRHAAEPPDEALRRCHEALRRTRGAVATVASLHAQDETVTWVGVGNVDGLLARAEAGAKPAYELAPVRPGILGFDLPDLRPEVLRVLPGDVLVLATDGVNLGYDRPIRARASAQATADRLLAEHGRGTDDALVLVARYLGGRE